MLVRRDRVWETAYIWSNAILYPPLYCLHRTIPPKVDLRDGSADISESSRVLPFAISDELTINQATGWPCIGMHFRESKGHV